MFASGSRGTLSIVVALALLGLWTVPVATQDSVSIAENVVRVAYGDLFLDPHRISVTLTPVSQSITADWNRFSQVFVQIDRDELKPIRTPADVHNQLLNVSLAIDGSGRPTLVQSAGTYVHSRDVDEMVVFARNHREFTDQAFLRELVRRGAQFVDTDPSDFERRLRLERFEGLLGQIVQRDVRFISRLPSGAPDVPDLFLFTWRVELHTQSSASEKDVCVLSYEPFDGRLIMMSRRIVPNWPEEVRR